MTQGWASGGAPFGKTEQDLSAGPRLQGPAPSTHEPALCQLPHGDAADGTVNEELQPCPQAGSERGCPVVPAAWCPANAIPKRRLKIKDNSKVMDLGNGLNNITAKGNSHRALTNASLPRFSQRIASPMAISLKVLLLPMVSPSLFILNFA